MPVPTEGRQPGDGVAPVVDAWPWYATASQSPVPRLVECGLQVVREGDGFAGSCTSL